MSNPVELSSTQLSQIVDLLIGTPDAIKTKKMRVTQLNKSHKWLTRYIIGSLCDGLELKGVDIYYMLVHKHLPVIYTLCSDESCITPPHTYLIACCSPSSSAYMCLEMHTQLRDMVNSRNM